jgi:exonuclease III
MILCTSIYIYIYVDALGQYTYWSMRTNGRPVNRGLRLDYFVVSRSLLPTEQNSNKEDDNQAMYISNTSILFNDCVGCSDHCPILLEICRK